MSMTKDLGNLLVTIDEASQTLFNDNAHVTHLVPSPRFEDEGILLDITVTILKSRYEDDDEYNFRRKMLEELIYNPMMHSEFILSKVNIVFLER